MNKLLLNPTDVLFFKDGRPMSGALAGHGAAWPLPSVTNAALHAALHRAKIDGVHGHDQIRLKNGNRERIGEDDRKFGSLTTAGPFPVCATGTAETWFFPRPLDAGESDTTKATFRPLAKAFERELTSLPALLKYSVTNTRQPSKDPVKPWWSEKAWNDYLGTEGRDNRVTDPSFKFDAEFAETEHSIGIGIDDVTGTQDGESFYSAHYLRLRDDWRIGLVAEALDKIQGNPEDKRDLLESLFPNHGTETPVITGGQQRICTVVRESSAARLPLPLGKITDFKPVEGKFLVKWCLLTPAIFPQISEGKSKKGDTIRPHPGGWLPNWIDPSDGSVLLKSGDTSRKEKEGRATWRERVSRMNSIPAVLVAAMTGKSVPVTGYALDNGLEDRKSGPKPTHLAVPAGSVYYFECPTSEDAEKLASTLNWHGSSKGAEIQNRRSTHMGEKGFGLGVCGTWKYHKGNRPQ